MEYNSIQLTNNLRVLNWGQLPVLVRLKTSEPEILGFVEPLSRIGMEIKYKPMHPCFEKCFRENVLKKSNLEL